MIRRSAIRLSVPQPCRQPWDQMVPAPQGRHCAACAHVVVDFRQMTDTELVAWFGAHPGQKVCGYYRPDQLGRPVQAAPQSGQQWSFWAVAAVSALAACASPPPETRMLPAMVVHGRVLPRPTRQSFFALVGFEGDTVYTFTDHTGRFMLAIPAHRADQQLLFASLTYPHLTASIPATSEEVEVTMNIPDVDRSSIPMGQTQIDTITPQGGRWPVPLHVLRRWISPPPPPPLNPQ